MRKGFVFGKFLPFHKGHEAMIRFALTHCDFVLVLICVSNKEEISGPARAHWLTNTFVSEPNIEIRLFDYKEEELPNSSESSEEISRIWADVFRRMIPDFEILVTSEPYGDYVARYMNIQHIPFDPARAIVPVAASVIRRNLIDNWRFLPDSVKPYFTIKVVILGTESTGKTTLTQNLANHFTCTEVKEAGRDLIENSNEFEFSDLEKVAVEHAQRIENAMIGNHPLIIIDTDIHITQSYAQFVFGRSLETEPSVYQANKANLYLYLDKDAPYIQDGTRMEEGQRNLLDESHRFVLEAANIDYVVIRGNWEERYREAIESIQNLLSRTQGFQTYNNEA
jgi:HTH-type transcriptional regulator, transcriptional repressor of NAD biosynthesis genes